jgi:hypothetical protein
MLQKRMSEIFFMIIYYEKFNSFFSTPELKLGLSPKNSRILEMSKNFEFF